MLGIAALLGPWAAHLVCRSSSFHYLAAARRKPARRRAKGPQTRRVRRIPLHAGDEAGAPLGRSGMGVLYLFLRMPSISESTNFLKIITRCRERPSVVAGLDPIAVRRT